MVNRTVQFFKGISTQTIVTILMGVVELVVFAILSRLLSKTDFGYFATLSGIIMIVMSISEAGLGASIIQKKNISDTFISTAFTWSCLLGCVASLIVFLFAPFLAEIIVDKALTIPLRIMSVTIFLHSLISVGNGILYRELSFKIVGYISVLSYIISSVISVVIASQGGGLTAVIVLPVANTILQILGISFFVKWPQLRILKSETKEIFSFGGWLTFGVIFNNLTHQLDKLLLPKWMSIDTLGAYNRPAGFVSSISTKLNGIFDTVLFPILSDLQENRTKVNGVFNMAISLLNSFSIILFALFFFNAHLIISVFFGNKWIDLVPIMQIVSISVIFNINGRLVDCFFRSLAYVKLGFYLRVLSVVITLICIYVGSSYGISGVAVAIVMANVTNILIKLGALAIKTDTSLLEVVKRMLIAWRSVLPILPIGVTFLIVRCDSLSYDICFAFIFVIVVVLEFIYFPQFIGETYLFRVYPIVNKMIPKMMRR